MGSDRVQDEEAIQASPKGYFLDPEEKPSASPEVQTRPRKLKCPRRQEPPTLEEGSLAELI